jgi:hypothetical protein
MPKIMRKKLTANEVVRLLARSNNKPDMTQKNAVSSAENSPIWVGFMAGSSKTQSYHQCGFGGREKMIVE